MITLAPTRQVWFKLIGNIFFYLINYSLSGFFLFFFFPLFPLLTSSKLCPFVCPQARSFQRDGVVDLSLLYTLN